MPNTAIWGLPYPTQTAATVGPDVPADILALANSIDSRLTPFTAGLLADRPGFGKPGQRYLATDNGRIYLDIGTAWLTEVNDVDLDQLSPAVIAAFVAAGDARLTDQRVPTDGSVTAAKIAAALKPSGGAAAGTEALRALGTTPGTAAAGNDSRLSDTRVPTAGSVTDSRVSSGAAIDPAKIAGTAVVQAAMTAEQNARINGDNTVNNAVIAEANTRAARDGIVGRINADGSVAGGSGFTCTGNILGYQINFNVAFPTTPILDITVIESGAFDMQDLYLPRYAVNSNSQVQVYFKRSGHGSNSSYDLAAFPPFSFTARPTY